MEQYVDARNGRCRTGRIPMQSVHYAWLVHAQFVSNAAMRIPVLTDEKARTCRSVRGNGTLILRIVEYKSVVRRHLHGLMACLIWNYA